MSFVELGTKNDCAGEGEKQFTRPDQSKTGFLFSPGSFVHSYTHVTFIIA
jgi:hypothetical protein